MQNNDLIAEDSNREVTPFGHLKVKDCILTAESVDEYLGSELQGTGLNLDANAIYKVYRPAEELRKAIDSYNDVPLTNEHFFVDELEHNRSKWLGTTGSNAELVNGKVKNNVVLWSKDGIDLVEKVKDGLSSGYSYTLVKESGSWNGKPYDFKMVDICCNHVALVENPRVKIAKLADNDVFYEVTKNMDKSELLRYIADNAPDLARKLIADKNGKDDSHTEKTGKENTTDNEEEKEKLSDEELKELENVVHAKKDAKDKKAKDEKDDDLVEDNEEEPEKEKEKKKAEDSMSIKQQIADAVSQQLKLYRETQELCEKVIGKTRFAVDATPEQMIDNTLRAKNINYENYGLETKKALLQYIADTSAKEKQVKKTVYTQDSSFSKKDDFQLIDL